MSDMALHPDFFTTSSSTTSYKSGLHEPYESGLAVFEALDNQQRRSAFTQSRKWLPAVPSFLPSLDIISLEDSELLPADFLPNRALLSVLLRSKRSRSNLELVSRLRALMEIAEEEGEAISMSSALSFLVFSKVIRWTRPPVVALTRDGAIHVEWRTEDGRSLAIQLKTPLSIVYQYLEIDPESKEVRTRLHGVGAFAEVSRAINSEPLVELI